jgi:hypothetical protein
MGKRKANMSTPIVPTSCLKKVTPWGDEVKEREVNKNWLFHVTPNIKGCKTNIKK